MALHIDEIAIQLSVAGPSQAGGRGSSRRRPKANVDGHGADDEDDQDRDTDQDERFSASNGSGCCDHQAIVADAVQGVLRILRDQESR